MKQFLARLSMALLLCCSNCTFGIIPFNPDLDKATGLIKLDEGKKVQVGKVEKLGSNFTPDKRDPFKALRLVSDYDSVTVIDDSKAVDVAPWTNWATEDEKAERLFRPFAFYDVMGMREYHFKNSLNSKTSFPILDYIKKNGKDPDANSVKETLAAFPGRKKLLGSTFSPIVSVKDLRTKYETMKKSGKIKQANTTGQFGILDGWKIWAADSEYLKKWNIKKGGLLSTLKHTDIRYLQEANPGAMFQLASTFSTLEGGMGHKDALLETMQHAPVQGENASLGTMGATIIRKYAYHADKNLNILEYLNDKLTVDYKGIITEVKTPLTDNDIDKIGIGLHENVLVTSGYYPPYIRTQHETLKDIGGELKKYGGGSILLTISDEEKDEIAHSNESLGASAKDRIQYMFNNKFTNPENKKYKNSLVDKNRNPVFVYNSIPKKDIRIDQVLTAALQFNKIKDEKTARILLKGSYLATILAAATQGVGQLYLTLVGAGAFGNKIEWIKDALDTDEIREIIAYTGMQVVIINYVDIRGKTIPKVAKDWTPFKDKGLTFESVVENWNKQIREIELNKLTTALNTIAQQKTS